MKSETADMDTVARLAGVSKATVHRALQNTGRISPMTREKVLAVAAQIGYRPNRLARSLREQRSATLGVVVTSIAGSLYAHALEGIESVLQEQDYSVLLACSHSDFGRERAAVELLREKQVDGLIVVPADPEQGSEFYAALTAQDAPLVFLDRAVPESEADAVATDHEAGGYLAARCLLQAGRRRIGFVSTLAVKRRYASVRERLRGCNRALAEAGLPPAVEIGPGVPDRETHHAFGYTAMQSYLQTGNRLDGLFAVNDQAAYGAILALAEAGLRVPDDIAVVGYDDLDMSAYFSPPLTTVRQPMHTIGTEAARLLIRRIDRSEPAPPRRLLLEPTLIIRRSCAAAIGGASP